MKRTGPTNEHLRKLIADLRELGRKEKARLWLRIADDLEKPTRQRRAINLSKINEHTSENDQIIVPGKLLATGDISHKIIVAAWQFSGAAVEKIRASQSQMLSINELMEKNPKAKGIKIIG